MGIRIKRVRYKEASTEDLEDFEATDVDNPTFFTDKLNKVRSKLDFFNKNISLDKNFNSYIVEVDFAAGETKNIQHFLGVRPKYRIILKQEGNGVLSDIPSAWDNQTIRMINNGAVAVKATIMILKE